MTRAPDNVTFPTLTFAPLTVRDLACLVLGCFLFALVMLGGFVIGQNNWCDWNWQHEPSRAAAYCPPGGAR